LLTEHGFSFNHLKPLVNALNRVCARYVFIRARCAFELGNVGKGNQKLEVAGD
jgi:hypothetical protein